jgi:hypothetical protein
MDANTLVAYVGGESVYVDAAIERCSSKDENKWCELFEVGYLLGELMSAHDKTLHKSALFLISQTYGQVSAYSVQG